MRVQGSGFRVYKGLGMLRCVAWDFRIYKGVQRGVPGLVGVLQGLHWAKILHVFLNVRKPS